MSSPTSWVIVLQPHPRSGHSFGARKQGRSFPTRAVGERPSRGAPPPLPVAPCPGGPLNTHGAPMSEQAVKRQGLQRGRGRGSPASCPTSVRNRWHRRVQTHESGRRASRAGPGPQQTWATNDAPSEGCRPPEATPTGRSSKVVNLQTKQPRRGRTQVHLRDRNQTPPYCGTAVKMAWR